MKKESVKEASEAARLLSEYQSAVVTVQHQKTLLERLENDLLKVNCLERTEAEGSDNPKPESPTEFLTDAITTLKNFESKTTVVAGDTNSLLPIVASQRERFKQRAEELEVQSLDHHQQMTLLENEIERMRNDNVKLYEKIKFLQSYQGKKVVSPDDIETRYQTEYESLIDPFRRFSNQEKQRKYASLSTLDKATLSLGRSIMGSSQARAIFLLYLIILHCLVFAVLYKLALQEACKRDFAHDCVNKFREHMQSVHGQKMDG